MHRTGDWVEVKSAAEILATLDSSAELEHMPLVLAGLGQNHGRGSCDLRQVIQEGTAIGRTQRRSRWRGYESERAEN